MAKAITAAALSVAALRLARSARACGPGDLSEPTLYEFLLGEIALQRGDLPLAAKTYLDLARRTRDPRVARRAVEVANQAKPELSSRSRPRALVRARARLGARAAGRRATLVAAKRVDEAGPVLEKLLTAEGVNRENAFMQLNRLLAGNPDKAANLRVMRRLAAKHPQLPQAHFALARRPRSPATTRPRSRAARRARSCGPTGSSRRCSRRRCCSRARPRTPRSGWASSSRSNPNAREARLNYARVLVLDKRLPEARKQFEAVANANPAEPGRDLRGRPARLPAEGLRGGRGLHEARARPRLPRPRRRALPAGADRRGAEAVAAGDPVVREHRRRRPRAAGAHAHRQRDREAGQARRGARLSCSASPPSNPRTRRSSPSPRRRSCATRNATRTRSSSLARRSTSSPSSPTCSTTSRSPPRSSSASTCSRPTCAS